MESVRVVKDEGRVPRDRSLVPMHLVASPFARLGGSDSPLAQAVHGGAPVGKTVVEPGPAKVDGDERKEQAVAAGPSQGPMDAEERELVGAALLAHINGMYATRILARVSEAFKILIQTGTSGDVENLIKDLNGKDIEGELGSVAAEKKKLIAEALGILRTKHGFGDEQIVRVLMQIEDANSAAEIVLRQTEPRLWVVNFLRNNMYANGFGRYRDAMDEKLRQFARQVLLGEQPPTS